MGGYPQKKYVLVMDFFENFMSLLELVARIVYGIARYVLVCVLAILVAGLETPLHEYTAVTVTSEEKYGKDFFFMGCFVLVVFLSDLSRLR